MRFTVKRLDIDIPLMKNRIQTIILLAVTALLPFIMVPNNVLAQATWVGGNLQGSANPVYGTKGVPAPDNQPGSRANHVSVNAKVGPELSGTRLGAGFYLYGGIGFNTAFRGVTMGDLWYYEFDSEQWVWIAGPNTGNNPAVLGDKGVEAETNFPGSIHSHLMWVDKDDYLWLFGGTLHRNQRSNRLWRFNPLTLNWTWMKGDEDLDSGGEYGTKGTDNIDNNPASREGAMGWYDATGHNLWVFGGRVLVRSGTFSAIGLTNDVWRYNIADNTWTWIAGLGPFRNATDFSRHTNKQGYFTSVTTGPLPDETPYPGTRLRGSIVVDNDGKVILFGGEGYLSQRATIRNTWNLNDVWQWDYGNNRWINITDANSTTVGERDAGLYIFKNTNRPSGRYESHVWFNSQNQLMVFGGLGYDGATTNTRSRLADLWLYDFTSSQWGRVGGEDSRARSFPTASAFGEYSLSNYAGRTSGGSVYTAPGDRLGLFGGLVEGSRRSDGSNAQWEFEIPFYVRVLSTTGDKTSERYINLNQAFDAINNGEHTGIIEVQIQLPINMTEGAVLNASGTGSASYTSVDIYPVSELARLTFDIPDLANNPGDVTPESTLNFNGASNITLDGRLHSLSGVLAGSEPVMVVENINRQFQDRVHTIVFSGGASYNVVRYVDIRKNYSPSSTQDESAITFLIDSSADQTDNIIEYNIFNPIVLGSGAAPSNIIRTESDGSSGKITSLQIRQNRFPVIGNTTAIDLAAPSENIAITNNDFFHNRASRVTVNTGFAFIRQRSSTAIGSQITNNQFGGSEPGMLGGVMELSPNTSSARSSEQRIIHIAAGSATVESNVISNMVLRSNTMYILSVTGTGHAVIRNNRVGFSADAGGDQNIQYQPFGIFRLGALTWEETIRIGIKSVLAGIQIETDGTDGAGDLLVEENFMGGFLANESPSNVNPILTIRGIQIQPSNNRKVRVNENRIGVDFDNTSRSIRIEEVPRAEGVYIMRPENSRFNLDKGFSDSIEGIFIFGAGSDSLIVSNNRIENLAIEENLANIAGSKDGAANMRVHGIHLNSVQNARVSGNSIRNLSNNVENLLVRPSEGTLPGTNVSNGVSVAGIFILNSPNYEIIGNRIEGLTNTNPDGQTSVFGIADASIASGFNQRLIESNSLVDVTMTGSHASGALGGLYMGLGGVRVQNNLLAVGHSYTGASAMYGIWMNQTDSYSALRPVNIHHNTVSVGGANTEANGSHALLLNTIPQYNLRNNILLNARSNDTGGSGTHTAITMQDVITVDNVDARADQDFNLYFADGTGGETARRIQAGETTNFTAPPFSFTTTGGQDMGSQDENSFNLDPGLENDGGTEIDDYRTELFFAGNPVAGVSTDLTGVDRRSIPMIGALEYAYPWPAGDGSMEDPFHVTTPELLDRIRSFPGLHYKLVNDIVFTSEGFDEGGGFYNGGSFWQPIGTDSEPFTGSLDGNGLTISGLKSNRDGAQRVGLFGVLGSGGSLTDVRLADAEIAGDDSIGALVGENFGTVTRGSVVGTSTVSGSINVGGLVGRNHGSIALSFSDANVTVTGLGNVGGLVGLHQGSAIANSYSIGAVTGVNNVGGLVGMAASGTIDKTYAAGVVTDGGSANNLGGLIGADMGSPTVSNSFWDEERSGLEVSAGGAGATGVATTAEMKVSTPFANADWDFNGDEGPPPVVPVWSIKVAETDGAISYPYLTTNAPVSGEEPGLELDFTLTINVNDGADPAVAFDGAIVRVLFEDPALPVKQKITDGSGEVEFANLNADVARVTVRHFVDGVVLTDQLAAGPYRTNATLTLVPQARALTVSDATTVGIDIDNGQVFPVAESAVLNESEFETLLAARDVTLRAGANLTYDSDAKYNVSGVTRSLNMNSGGDLTFADESTLENTSGTLNMTVSAKGGVSQLATSTVLLKGDLTIGAGSSIDQDPGSTLNVQGTLSVTAGGPTHDVNVSSATNQVGGALSVSDAKDINVRTATALSVSQLTNIAGNIGIATQSGNLVLLGDVMTSATGASAFVELSAHLGADAGDAAGGNILLAEGKTVSVGTGGSVRLFTGDYLQSRALSALATIDNVRFNANPDTDFTGAPLATGASSVIYRELAYATGDGTDSDPYAITDWKTLHFARYFLDEEFTLNASLSDDSDFNADFASATANGDTGWQPIGTETSPFTGVFDGNGNNIADLVIDRPLTDYTGLFARIEGATISNLGITGADIKARNDAGILAGRISGASTVTSVFATGSIQGEERVGGLTGQSEGTSTISESYTVAQVTGTDVLGGFVGRHEAETITNAYALGSVTTTDDSSTELGGFAGHVNAAIGNSYASVAVTNNAGTDPTDKGFTGAGSGTITNSFWNIGASGQTTSTGGATGLTEAQIRDFVRFSDTESAGLTTAWDIARTSDFNTTSLWLIENGASFPYLRQRIPDELPGTVIISGTVSFVDGDNTLPADDAGIRFEPLSGDFQTLFSQVDGDGTYFRLVADAANYSILAEFPEGGRILRGIIVYESGDPLEENDFSVGVATLTISDATMPGCTIVDGVLTAFASCSVNGTELTTALQNGNITLEASGDVIFADNGDLNPEIDDTDNHTLTVNAGERIVFEDGFELTATGDGTLSLDLNSQEGIVQQGTTKLVVTGTTTLNAGILDDVNAITPGTIQLSSTNNEFSGAVSVTSATDVTIRAGAALTLGEIRGPAVLAPGTGDFPGVLGTINIATTSDDLTLTEDVTTTSTSAQAIVLGAGIATAAGTFTGGNVIFADSGTTAVVRAGSGASIRYYTGSFTDSDGLATLVSDRSDRRFNTAFTDAVSLGSGTFSLYRERPADPPAITLLRPETTTLIAEFNEPDFVGSAGTAGITMIQYSLDNGVNWINRDTGTEGESPLTITGFDAGSEVNVRFRYVTTATDGTASLMFTRTLFNSGEGTDLEPFSVSNAAQLNSIRHQPNKMFIQTADIVFDGADFNSGGAFYNEGRLWQPIGTADQPFTGEYRGDNHTISGLQINRLAADNVGLFGVVSGSNAEIKELGLLDVNIVGRDHTGALMGRLDAGATLSAVYATGSVRGRNHAGGLIGRLNNGTTLTNGYTLVGVFGADHVGGLAGSVNGSGTTIDRAYSAGRVRLTGGSSANIGGLIGSTSGTTHTVTNSFWDLPASERETSPGGGTGKTPAQMRVLATFTNTATDGLDAAWAMSATSASDETLWKLTEGISYPYFRLNAQDPLPGAAVLSGVVRDLNGDPLESIEVNVRLTDNQVALPAQTSDAGGAFSFTIADNVGYDLYARSETGSGTNLFISGYSTYEAGGDPTSVVLTLAPRSLTIGHGATNPSCFVDGEIFAFSDCTISTGDVTDALLAADTELIIRSSADLFLTGELTPTLAAARTLTLQAAGNIRLESSSEITASDDELTLNLQPNVDNTGTDQLLLAGDINTNGGDITLSINGTAVSLAGSTLTAGGAFSASSGGSLITTSDASLNTGTGNITLNTGMLDLNGTTDKGLVTTTGSITLEATTASLGGLIKTEGAGLTINTGTLTVKADGLLESNGGALAITTAGATSLGTDSKVSSTDLGDPDGTFSLSTGSLTLSSGAVLATGEALLTLLTDNLSADAASTVTTSELIISPRTTSRNMALGGSGTSLNIPANFFTDVANGTSHVRVGADDATGSISTQAVTFPDRTTLKTGADIALGAVTATGYTLTIDAQGSVTQTGGLTTTDQVLELRGDGIYILDHPDNAIHRLDAGLSGARIGALAVLNNAEFTVDAVWSSGTVDLGTLSSNMNIDGAINTEADGPDALRIAAGQSLQRGATTDGNIIMADPAPAVTVGTGGRALFYAGSLINSTRLDEMVTVEANRISGTDFTTDIGPGGLNLATGGFATPADGFFALLRESEPGIPVLAALTPTATSLVIAFNAPEDDGGATIDQYQYSFDNGATWTALAGTESPATISGLDAGEDYTLQLRAVNSAGASDPTGPFPRTLFAGGEGTSIAPFQVGSVKQLNSVRYQPAKHFVQTFDLEFTAGDFAEADGGDPEGAFYDNGALWLPIGSGRLDTGLPSAVFSGVYDADNHTIDGLRINRGSADNIGLFGVISGSDAQITSLGLTDTDITGRDYTGAVVGRIRNAAEVTQVFATGEVTGRNYVGGLAGHLDGDNSELSNSYSFAEVAGITHTGGLVGTVDGPAGTTLTNTYAAGPITRRSGVATTIGGLIGSVAGTPTITSSYFDAIAMGRMTTAAGTAKNPIEMRTLSTYDGWDIAIDSTELWKISDGISYPFFTAMAPADIPGSAVLGGIIAVGGETFEQAGIEIRARFAGTNSFIATATTNASGAWELTIADNVDYELFVRDAIGTAPNQLYRGGYLRYESGETLTGNAIQLAARSLTIGTQTTVGCMVEGAEAFAYTNCTVSAAAVKEALEDLSLEAATFTLRTGGDLTYAASIETTLPAARTLVAEAGANVFFAESSVLKASDHPLHLTIIPDRVDAVTDRTFSTLATLETNGGSIEIDPRNLFTIILGGQIKTGGGALTAESGSGRTIRLLVDADIQTGSGGVTLDASERITLEANARIQTTAAPFFASRGSGSQKLTLDESSRIESGGTDISLVITGISVAGSARILTTGDLLILTHFPSDDISLAAATGGSDVLELPAAFLSEVIGPDVSTLRIGDPDHTGDIFTGSTPIRHELVLRTGGNVVFGPTRFTRDVAVQFEAADKTLSQTGPVIFQDPVTLARTALTLTGKTDATSVTLDNPGNQLARLSATDLQTLTVVNSRALRLDEITAAGAIDVRTVAGDLRVTRNITTASTNADALLLAAGTARNAGDFAGGQVRILADEGDPAPVITTGINGRALFYTGSLLNSPELAPTGFIPSENRVFTAATDTDISASGRNLPTSGFFALLRETTAGAPVISNIIPSSTSIEIVFSIPVNTGGSAITNYQYSIDDGASWIAFSPAVATSPVTITGLAAGTDVTVRLRALNLAGTGTPSAAVGRSLFPAGNGTTEAPFTISTSGQLDNIRFLPNRSYILIADIAFEPSDFAEADGGTPEGAFYNAGAGWQPIGTPESPFTGSFDGGNYTISGLVITRPDAQHVGLFGMVNGSSTEIRNLAVTNATIQGLQETGILIGYLVRGQIRETYVTGTLTGTEGTSDDTGGLVGKLGSDAGITDAYARVDVSGNRNVGALVGLNDGGQITRTYATSFTDSDTQIGLIGANTGKVTNSFWDADALNSNQSAGGTARSGTEMRSMATFTSTATPGLTEAWSMDTQLASTLTAGTGTWIIVNQNSFPYLRNLPETQLPGFNENKRFARISGNWHENTTWSTFGCAPSGEAEASNSPAANPSVREAIVCGGFTVTATAGNAVTHTAPVIIRKQGVLQVADGSSLTYNTGTFTIQDGGELRVSNGAHLMLQAAGTLVIEEEGILRLESGAQMLESGTITGMILVERLLSAGNVNRWLPLSSPVSEASFSSSRVPDTGALLSNLHTAGFPGSNDPDAPATSATVLVYNEPGDGARSDRFQPPSTNTMPSGRGFFTFVPDFKVVAGESQNVDFAIPLRVRGELNTFTSSEFTFPLTYSGTAANSANDGWNLLGNPFTSALDWTEADNWTKPDGLNGFIYVYDPADRRYRVSDSATASGDTNLDLLTSPVIAPFQAFWVKAENNTATELVVKPDARVINTVNSGLFRAVPDDSTATEAPHTSAETSRNSTVLLQLHIDGQSAAAALRFAPEFDTDFSTHDAYFLAPLARSFAYLSTVKDGHATLIHSLPPDMRDIHEIPVMLGAYRNYQSVSGMAVLEWVLGEDLPAGYRMYLVDTLTGESINMHTTQRVEVALDAGTMMKRQITSPMDLQADGTPVMRNDTGLTRFLIQIHYLNSLEEVALPEHFEIEQNFPNPFNPTTTIRYALPEVSSVRIELFDITGRRVAVLVDKTAQAPGRYSVPFNGATLASGVYVYRITAGQFTETRKMTLIK